MSPSRSRRSIGIAIAIPFLLALAAGPVAAVTPPVRYTIDVGSTCFAGVGPKSKNLSFTLKSGGGSTLGTTTARTSGTGRFETCFTGTVPIVTGTRMIAKQGSTVLRTFTIPALVVRADRGDDKVTGKAPAGKVVRVAAWDCFTDVSTCTKKVDRKLTASSKGTFSTDMTSVFDARGHDDLLVSYTTGTGDLIKRSREFPTVYVLPDFNTISVRADAGAVVQGTLLDGPGGAQIDAKAIGISPSGTGSWNIGPTTPEELRFSFESDAIVPVPDWVVQLPATTISGSCYANAKVLVEPTSSTRQFATTTDGNGDYQFNFATAPGGALDVSGQTVRVWCFTPAGDAHVVQVTAP